VGRRMTRVYYHLEPAGQQRFAELLHEYQQITQGIRLIAGGGDSNDGECPSPAVSAGSVPADAGQLEAEVQDRNENGTLHPGLCF